MTSLGPKFPLKGFRFTRKGLEVCLEVPNPDDETKFITKWISLPDDQLPNISPDFEIKKVKDPDGEEVVELILRDVQKDTLMVRPEVIVPVLKEEGKVVLEYEVIPQKVKIKPPENAPTLSVVTHFQTLYFSKGQGEHLSLAEGALLYVKSTLEKNHRGGYCTVRSRKRGYEKTQYPWLAVVPKSMKPLVVYGDTHPFIFQRTLYNRYGLCGYIKDHQIAGHCVVRANIDFPSNPVMEGGEMPRKIGKRGRVKIPISNGASFKILTMSRPHYFSVEESDYLLLTDGAVLFCESQENPVWSGWGTAIKNMPNDSKTHPPKAFPYKVHVPYWKAPFNFPHPYKITRSRMDKQGGKISKFGTIHPDYAVPVELNLDWILKRRKEQEKER